MLGKYTPERVLLKELEQQEQIEKERRRSWGMMGFVIGLTLGVSSMAYTEKAPIVALDEVTCFTNPSSFLALEGWDRVYDVDRMTVALLTGNEQSEMQRLPTLVCYDTAPGNEYRTIVHEWWWKRK